MKQCRQKYHKNNHGIQNLIFVKNVPQISLCLKRKKKAYNYFTEYELLELRKKKPKEIKVWFSLYLTCNFNLFLNNRMENLCYKVLLFGIIRKKTAKIL